MPGLLSQQLFTTAFELLPTLFLFGAPVIGTLILITAFVDARLPHAIGAPSHPVAREARVIPAALRNRGS